MTSKTKSDPQVEDLARNLMQMYVIRINGQDLVLLGPIMGWPEERDIEVESIGFGELVRVEDVIVMLHGMRGRGGEGSVMSKLQ